MLPSGVVRRTPNRIRSIPILSPEGGEEHIGYFLVPANSVEIKDHTNRALTYKRVLIEKVREWEAWKNRQGLMMLGKPTVFVPVESPTTSPDADPVDGDDLRVYVRAMFRRTTPLYGSNDDLVAQHQAADRYGVDLEATLRATNELPSTRSELVAGKNRNPMREAQKRRDELGLVRRVNAKPDEHGDIVADEATVDPE